MNNQPLTFDFSDPSLFVPIYVPLFSDNKRTKIVYGSRGSAKSFFVAQHMVIKCLRMPRGKFKCLMVRKMKEDVPSSIFDTVKKVIEWWGLEQYFRIYEGTHKIVCLLNGNSFVKKGLNAAIVKGKGNAKSIENPTDAIIDEADEITLNEYIKLSGSLRGSPEIEEYLVFNPPEEDHWIIKRFFPKDKESFEKPDGSHTYIKSVVANCVILHTTYKHNPFLTESELEFYTTLAEHNPEEYKSDGLGLLVAVKSGGEALKNFDKDQHVVSFDLFRPETRLLFCWDFNRRPHHTLGCWQFHHDAGLNIFYADLVREFTIEEASVREVAKSACTWAIDSGYKLNTIRLIGDHSGTKQMDSDMSTFLAKIVRQIERAGFDVIDETRANPSVVSSLEFLNDIFGGHIFLDDQSNFPGCKIAIRINQDCSFHIADYAKTKTDKEGKLLKVKKRIVVKDQGSQQTVTIEIRGHAVDESRYMAVGVFGEEYDNYRKK